MKTPNAERALKYALVASLICSSRLVASVVVINPGDFPSGITPITFTGLADTTEVNGLTVNGVLFNYLISGSPTNGDVVIDEGPGPTNHITPPNIVSIGDDSGILRMTLPLAATEVGFGYAILDLGTVTNATTISVYNGATLLGSLSYTGTSDPLFTGGFAGLQSTSPFNRVDITFNSTAAPAFALDNVLLAAVPEPSMTLVMLSGAVLLVLRRRRR